MQDYQREKMRSGVTESDSSWTKLYDEKLYLLPLVAKQQTTIPMFSEDGSVDFRYKYRDPELAPLIDSFIELTAQYTDGHLKIYSASLYMLKDVFALMRKLILTNYDFSNDELTELLTVSNQQLSVLYENMLKHIMRQ